LDADHIRLYAKASKTPEGTQEYLDKYVYGAQDHKEYLELIGGASHLDKLAADPTLGY
jgi:glutaconate CoA-transferase subunit A